jgi:hypothetical protein
MAVIDIYLAHRDSTKFIEKQIMLIKKYFKCNEGSKINIYGFVDGSSENIKEEMRQLWIKNNTTPIDIPNVIQGQNRNYISANESYGLAFTYIYQNYILINDHISVCIENDIFPFKDINIEEYIKGYEICGEVRFNAAQLPDRNVMFWLGFIIFNGKLMNDRELFSGLCKPIINKESGKTHWIDSGGQSYYWIVNKERKIRQMVTNGNDNYNGFTSLECTPHNITNDIECLPEFFREYYLPYFRVLVYDNCLIHLERMGKENDNSKELWWEKCYNKILNDELIYIPFGFQCTTAEILKKINKRKYSFPFDWIISQPEYIVKFLSILLEDNCNIEKFVKEEFLNIDSMLHFLKQEEFIIHEKGDILYNSKYNLIFPHFNNNEETITNMINRFERLRNFILFKNNKLNFVFVNRLINNNIDDIKNDKVKFSINNKNTNLNLKENIVKLNNLLLKHISSERFKIIVVNAVQEITNDKELDKNIIYNELIPINNSNLTDEEIIDNIKLFI